MTNKTFQWTVIGAGGAGIAAVGKLLDHNIKPHDILWIDPYFEVGDLGKYWKNIHGNTSVKYFLSFLNAAKSFNYKNACIDFDIKKISPEEKCTLYHMVEPLQWITDHLKNKVSTAQGFTHHIKLGST